MLGWYLLLHPCLPQMTVRSIFWTLDRKYAMATPGVRNLWCVPAVHPIRGLGRGVGTRCFIGHAPPPRLLAGTSLPPTLFHALGTPVQRLEGY
jgi:hypothetical protein